MLKIAGTNHLTENILKLKGIAFEKEVGDDFNLETRDFVLSDLVTIITYLDERYPVPQLISGDLANRTRIKEISSLALKHQEVCDDLVKLANPFIFGDTITLVDLIVYEATNNEAYKGYITKLLAYEKAEDWR